MSSTWPCSQARTKRTGTTSYVSAPSRYLPFTNWDSGTSRRRFPLRPTSGSEFCTRNHRGNFQTTTPGLPAVGSSVEGGGDFRTSVGFCARARNLATSRASSTSGWAPGEKRQLSKAPMMTEPSGKSIMAPGPNVVRSWLDLISLLRMVGQPLRIWGKRSTLGSTSRMERLARNFQ